MELPLEILGLIFKELCLEDKLQLAKTATFLKDAFIFSCGNDFRQISDRGPPRYLWPCIFQLCGSYIEEIDVDALDAQESKLVENNCPNLKVIKLLYITKGNVTLVKSLLLGLKNLRKIKIILLLDKGYVGHEITHCLQDQDFPNLKVLEITMLESYECEFSYIANVLTLVNLEKLTIGSDCGKMKIKINEIFTSLKKLSWLELFGQNIISTIGEMETCSSLKVLKMEFCTFSSVLPNCPNLQRLFVLSSKFCSNVNMLSWFKNQSNSLESLGLDEDLLNFYSQWLGRNVWEFPALKNLYFNNYRTTNDVNQTTKWPNCPKLKYLRLQYNPDNVETFDWFSRHAETLESMEVNLSLNSYDFPYLPKLRSVCLTSSELRLDAVCEWISRQSKTLYSLELMWANLNVVDVGKLISCCKKLRILSILWNVGLFKASWFPFFDTLKENKVTLDEPFIVKIYYIFYIEENAKWLFLQKLSKSPNFELCKFQFKLNKCLRYAREER